VSESNQSENNSTPNQGKGLEKGLERMEALLKQSANGIHVLFKNSEIAAAIQDSEKKVDFCDFNQMKKVQEIMTSLISKKTFNEKMDYIKDLDPDSYQMLIRTYFHIVENTVRANTEQHH
jgi:hypothetical protein